MPKLNWTPWHKVVSLKDDLRTGDLTLKMFASDLYDVVMKNGLSPIYEDPVKFFSITLPTYSLRELIRDVLLRLSGQNDKAVRQLELTYGGGKTHTLITMHHLVNDPENLPSLPAVNEFISHTGARPPKTRVIPLCFDKMDVEKGMEVKGPEGGSRWLANPWSVFAYQLAGEAGLQRISADGSAEERETAPAENLIVDLLTKPAVLPTLILIDEVLMYARGKIGDKTAMRSQLVNFFQYLTQAVAKVDKCCVVASLLATEPEKTDRLGKEILAELYDIFMRQREETVQPVQKEDVAELLRRRFFTPDSIMDRESFRPHVTAALKGITDVDDKTRKEGASEEERFLKSYPFHPDLTEIFYGKWTNLERFQRTRGVLRTFALALRSAEIWDQSPLIGPHVFLSRPADERLSGAARELINVAETEEYEGRKQAWTPILEGELSLARDIQEEASGLKRREVEAAVFATFLHSQPVGQSATLRELTTLLGASRPGRIELEKGLTSWAGLSHWLDDRYTEAKDTPGRWKLGNRPNLNQMHAVAARNISEDIVEACLIDEISKNKHLTKGASAGGVHVHTLPKRPADIDDNGELHFVTLGPIAASESGKPSAEAKKYLNEKTGPENPRVFRNALILATPSKDGIEVARNRIRDYLAWKMVQEDLKKQEGEFDAQRIASLHVKLDKARNAVPEAIRQAYCIVVTVSKENTVHAFKVTAGEEPLFQAIKASKDARIQDTAITAGALLPGGPYDLWRDGDAYRRVKDLAGAFAQLSHLPKMLNTRAIVDTLADGCEKGFFILRLPRPDRTFRTWWRVKPDDSTLKDPALELVLPEYAELSDIPFALLEKGNLPGLWKDEDVEIQAIFDYFKGENVDQFEIDGIDETLTIPKASEATVASAVSGAVLEGKLWLVSGSASVLEEEIPTGLLTPAARVRMPPRPIPAPNILPVNLPSAWKDNETTALSIHTALNVCHDNQNLPWKTVRDVIDAALKANFISLDVDPQLWPCELTSAKTIKLKQTGYATGGDEAKELKDSGVQKVLRSAADLESSQLQDLGEAVPDILKITAKYNISLRFRLHVEIGDGETMPDENAIDEMNMLLGNINENLKVE